MSRLLHAAHAQLARTSSPRDTARSDRFGYLGVCRPKANHPSISVVTSAPEVRALSSAGATRLHRSYGPVRLPLTSPSKTASRPLPSCQTGLPRLPASPFRRAVPLPRRIEWVRLSIASPSVLPSPFCRRVGFRISTFGACSGFTHVTARRIAQPPKAAFVTRLRSSRLPDRTARQLPEQSTILWAESSSTGDPRLRGALRKSRISQHARKPYNIRVSCCF